MNKFMNVVLAFCLLVTSCSKSPVKRSHVLQQTAPQETETKRTEITVKTTDVRTLPTRTADALKQVWDVAKTYSAKAWQWAKDNRYAAVGTALFVLTLAVLGYKYMGTTPETAPETAEPEGTKEFNLWLKEQEIWNRDERNLREQYAGWLLEQTVINCDIAMQMEEDISAKHANQISIAEEMGKQIHIKEEMLKRQGDYNSQLLLERDQQNILLSTLQSELDKKGNTDKLQERIQNLEDELQTVNDFKLRPKLEISKLQEGLDLELRGQVIMFKFSRSCEPWTVQNFEMTIEPSQGMVAMTNQDFQNHTVT